MELRFSDSIEACMKRDGRTLAHNTLEEMRVLAVQRMNEGERPAVVAESFGMHRSWAFKCRAQARGRGKGVRVLRSTKGTGRPRKMAAAQEAQVFRWINGKNPMRAQPRVGDWGPQKVPSARRFQPLPRWRAIKVQRFFSGTSRGFALTLCTARPGAYAVKRP